MGSDQSEKHIIIILYFLYSLINKYPLYENPHHVPLYQGDNLSNMITSFTRLVHQYIIGYNMRYNCVLTVFCMLSCAPFPTNLDVML